MNLDLLNEKLINPELLEKIIYFKEIDSTNLYAKNNQKTATDNSLILTSFQTKGIGRFGKNWESLDESNLTFSIVKHRKIRIDEIHFMNFYSSYILFQTVKSFISEFQNNKLYLKWPNDIILNGKKTAGMLLVFFAGFIVKFRRSLQQKNNAFHEVFWQPVFAELTR